MLKIMHTILPIPNVCPKNKKELYALVNARKRASLFYEIHKICGKCTYLLNNCLCGISAPAQIVLFDVMAQINSILKGFFKIFIKF